MELVINHSDFIRIDNDTNGNPRYAIHWLALTRFENLGVNSYEGALYYGKLCGGRKYHNKKYGGGIAFQTYNLQDTINKLNTLQIL